MSIAAKVPHNRQPEAVPAYSVEPLEGNREVVRSIFDEKTRKIERRKIEEPAGFLIKTSRGDSLRIRNLDELEIYGLGDSIPLIAEQIGQTVGEMPNQLLAKKGAK